MIYYDITDCDVSIVKPGTNLTTYVKNKKPFAVCNASLYDLKSRIPCGTIIENGVCVHGEGEKYGFGVRANGEYGFDFPWPYGKTPWKDFISGYPTPVRNGKYVAPEWRDDYVFNTKANRIGIGEKNKHLYIVCDNSVTMKQYANNAIKNGFNTLVAFDGGSSRHLYYNGMTVYASGRIPYNAIVCTKKQATKPTDPPTSNNYQKPIEVSTGGSIGIGSSVRVKQGAKTYTGGKLASFVYNTTYKVKQINGDRVVITYTGIVVAAVKIGDLVLV